MTQDFIVILRKDEKWEYSETLFRLQPKKKGTKLWKRTHALWSYCLQYVKELKLWLEANHLKFNSGKRRVILIGSKSIVSTDRFGW